ncbi:hypothetical protein HAX54_050387 [Datura stramonium]|uniref:UDP-glycosyltransferase n=1 Tax=Datura stramonium TaxID=4076 RepID=A0ABS8WQ90_DATST|nr:hypothetical protein [Datura stramonium]
MPIAGEFNIPKYVYHTSNAWSAALIVHTQIFDKQIQGQYVDLKEPLVIPGCTPIRPEDVIDPMLDQNDQRYRDWMIQGVEYNYSDGVLMNTWDEFEPLSIQTLRENEHLRAVSVKMPFYAIGPLTRKPDNIAGDRNAIDRWLDNQPLESVLYVFW